MYISVFPAEQIITGNYIPNISPQVINFFLPPRAETHTRLLSHLSLSLRHTCENMIHFHTKKALFPVFLRSDVDVSCCSSDSDRKQGEGLGAYLFIYFAFLPVYSRNSV